MPVNEQELKRLYCDERLPEREIANRLGVSQSTIGNIRRRLGIRALERHERLGEIGLTIEQKSILLGSMLGDGSIGMYTKHAYYQESHGIQQEAYCRYKEKVFNNLICYSGYGSSTLGNKKYRTYGFKTHAIPELNRYHGLFYPDGKGMKRYCNLNPNEVDPLALAIWFMDDGFNARNHYCGFSCTPILEDVDVLLRILGHFGIPCRSYQYPRGNGYLESRIMVLTQLGYGKFVELIRPYMHHSLLYKIRE